MHKQHKTTGFTIVELLIVVVVIAILAAISLVAYIGITNRANTSAAMAAATQAATKLSLYYAENDRYPAALSDAGLTDPNLQYSYSNATTPKTFCVTATTATKSVYVSSTTSVATEGGCAGHGQGGVAAVTNYVTNTSTETDTANHQNIGVATGRAAARVAVPDAHSGSYVFRVTQPTASADLGGYGSNSASVPPGQYQASLWVRSNQAVAIRAYLEGSALKSNQVPSGSGTLTPNVWKRLSMSVDVTSAGTVKVGWLISGVTPVANTYVDMDDIMLTSGATLYNFGDGSSPNWIWNGTANSSTSTGPEL